MALNTHLINLLSVRERQRLEGAKTPTAEKTPTERSFGQVLRESMATPGEGPAVTEALRVAKVDEVPRVVTDTQQRIGTERIMNPEHLVERFLAEQDLVLAAQQVPGNRYRNTPDDDTSGEQEVRANLRPVD
ncbi:hypothetical protein CMK11_02680 [Candidatus Poribacteria bacterium]|nr:hypothetical protein [Candidatus Poribacteria bacterium]